MLYFLPLFIDLMKVGFPFFEGPLCGPNTFLNPAIYLLSPALTDQTDAGSLSPFGIVRSWYS